MSRKFHKPTVVLGVVFVAFVMFTGVAQASPPQWTPLYAAPSASAPSVGAIDTDTPLAPSDFKCWVRGDNGLVWLRASVRTDEGLGEHVEGGFPISGYISTGEQVPEGARDGTTVNGFPGCPPVSTCGGRAGHIVQLPLPFRPNASFYVDPVGCQLRHVPTAEVYFCLVNQPPKGYGVKDDKVQVWFVLRHLHKQGPNMSCEYPARSGSNFYPGQEN